MCCFQLQCVETNLDSDSVHMVGRSLLSQVKSSDGDGHSVSCKDILNYLAGTVGTLAGTPV